MSGDVIVLSPSMGIKREQPQCGLRARRALAPIKIQGMIASGKSYEDALRNDGYVPGAVFARSFRPEGFVLRHCSSKTARSESPSISLVEASAQESSERKFAAASSTPEWERLAVKCTEERRGAGEMARLLQKEYDILRTLSHLNIVMAKHLVEADFGCAMVMELCAGDRLDRVTRESNNLSGESKRSITEQILCAVEYLHSEQVCHRNLHPRNIVVNKNTLAVKIVDFKCACQEQQPGTPWSSRSQDDQELPIKISDLSRSILPPVGADGTWDMFSLDIFAIGLLTLSLMVGRWLVTENVVKGNAAFKVNAAMSLSMPAETYVRSLLTSSADQRPSASVAHETLPHAMNWPSMLTSGGY